MCVSKPVGVPLYVCMYLSHVSSCMQVCAMVNIEQILADRCVQTNPFYKNTFTFNLKQHLEIVVKYILDQLFILIYYSTCADTLTVLYRAGTVGVPVYTCTAYNTKCTQNS